VPISLDSFERVDLAHLPTPLERLPRLSAALGGPEIWVKRDDCTGLATGGNKARKLEYLLGAALAEHADTVITVGGVQSNHARQTAAAAAHLGLRCQLVLPRVVPRSGVDYEQSGNVLLDRLLGAELFIVDDEADAGRQIQALLQAARDEGRHAVVHPPGGSTPVGALGYVRAALELVGQAERAGPDFARVYAAVGTGGTLAGLAAGASLASWSASFTGVCVVGDAAKHRAEVESLLAGLSDLLATPALPHVTLDFDASQLGDGYGVPTEASLEAIDLCAKTEGLLLDPVYTSKAMAALVADVRAGRAGDQPILFWHTGGSSGLFAYRDELEKGATRAH
jgi:D-cysteine desulfhydrase/L-cysteate sulfo-lyase